MRNDRTEQRLLLLSILGAAISPYIGYTFLLFLFLFCIYRIGVKKLVISCKKNKFLCSVLFYLVFQLILTNYIFYSFQAFILIILQISAYITVRRKFQRDEEYGQLINTLVLGSIIISLIGIIQYFSLEPSALPKSWVDKKVYSIQIRVYSTLYNPNVLAAYLVSMICITITSLEEMKKRPLHMLSLFLCTLCLIFTYSRAALLALAAVMMVLIAVKKDRKYVVYAVIIVIMAIVIDGNNYAQRMNPEFAAKDSSIGYRMEIYKSAISIIKDHYLFGTGLNTMQVYINKYSASIKAPVFHAHNIFLHGIAETGIVGVILLGIVLTKGIKNAIAMVIWGSDVGIKNIGLSMSIFYMALLIQGLTDAVAFAPQYSIFICVLIAMSDGIWMNNRNNRQHRW